MVQDLYEIGEAPQLGVVPKKMHAWSVRAERFGEPIKAFQKEILDVPSIAEDEVLVYVMAAGINYNNVWAGLGVPVNVIASRNKAGEKEDFHIGGSDASGVVHQVGKNVKNLRVGDEVVIHCGYWNANCSMVQAGVDPMYSPTFRIWGYETNYGSFAQFTRVQAHQCLPKPKHLTWEQAAAYMLVGATAYRMLLGWGEHALRKDDAVLIWGGAGGLGSMAIQIVSALGGIPISVISSDEKAEYCKKLGAKACINRKNFKHWGMLPHWKDKVGYNEWLKGVRAFGQAIWDALGEKKNPKIVFEHPGEDTIPTSIFVCETGGMVVICAGTTGYNATVDLRYLWMRQKRLQGSHFANDEQAQGINDLVRAGKVDPCLSQTFTYEELPLCHQLMYENKHPHGNMAVLIGAASEGLGAELPHPQGVSHVADLPQFKPETVYLPPQMEEEDRPSVVSSVPVRDVMTEGIITCHVNTLLAEVARLLLEHKIHAVVVLDETGDAVGLLSQTDLVLAYQGRSPAKAGERTAFQSMSKKLIYCEASTSVSEAITQMTRHRIHRLVVVELKDNKRQPIGVISMTDIVRTMIEV